MIRRSIPSEWVARFLKDSARLPYQAAAWFVQELTAQHGADQAAAVLRQASKKRGCFCYYTADDLLRGFLPQGKWIEGIGRAEPPHESTLAEWEAFRAEQASKAAAAVVSTNVGRRLSGALEVAEAGRLVVVAGRMHTGVRTGIQQWAATRPGMVRVTDVPAGSSRLAFLIEIGNALDGEVVLGSKTDELRSRLEFALRCHGPMLILQRAERLWTEERGDNQSPFRVQWVLQMAKRGVRICLVSDMDAWKAAGLGTRCPWVAQRLREEGDFVELPVSLNSDDLTAISRAMLPTADARSAQILVKLALSQGGILTDLSRAVFHAQRLACVAGRKSPTASDVRAAVKDWVFPSARAALSLLPVDARKGGHSSRTRSLVSVRLQEPCTSAETAPALEPEARVDFSLATG